MGLKQLADAFGNLAKLAGEESTRRAEMREVANSPTLLELREQALEGKPNIETRRKLWEMFTENTGAHFLDSGGAYGRAWQRNQLVDFEAKPYVRLSFDTWGEVSGSMDLSVNTYEWLAQRLEWHRVYTKSLHGLGNAPKYKDEGWLVCIEAWLKHKFPEAGGLYGEGEPMCINTYNHDNVLDATLQFYYWCDDRGTFVALQIHGGADVRGGYTAPQVFEVTGHSELAMLDDNDWHIGVDEDSIPNKPDPDQEVLPGMPEPRLVVPRWSHGCGGEIDCNVSIGVDWSESWKLRKELGIKDSPGDYEFSRDPEDRGKGELYVDEDGNGYCPHTGGRLYGYVY